MNRIRHWITVALAATLVSLVMLVVSARVVNAASPSKETPSPGVAVAPASHGNAKELVDKIIAGITRNYSCLGGIKTTIETINIDPNVKQREVITRDLPSGGRIEWTWEPRTISTTTILIRGDNLRAELIHDGQVQEILAFSDGVWTQYSPQHMMAWFRHSDQMGGRFPADPRDVFATDIRVRFTDQLRNCKVIETRSVKENGGQQLVEVLLQHASDSGEGQRCRYRFDPSRNLLPTKAEYLNKDNGVVITINADYQEVIPNVAWFLREAHEVFLSKQTMTIRTKDQVKIHQTIDDKAFEVDLPPGTRVSDVVLRKTYFAR